MPGFAAVGGVPVSSLPVSGGSPPPPPAIFNPYFYLLAVNEGRLMLTKNTAGQKVRVFAFDVTTNLPKTGDAANISAYISKDFGALAQLTDTSATEEDSTNAKGYYLFDISQTETNADDIAISGKSSTANIVVVGAPARIRTVAPNFAATSIDANGRLDIIKIAGTPQTARDIGASVLLSSGTGTGQVKLSSGYVAPNWGDVGNPTTVVNLSGTTVKTATDVEADTADIQTRLPASLTANGNIKASFVELISTVLTEGAAGRLKAAFTTFFDVASPVFTTASVNQTGDSFARIGATGSGLTSLAPASTALSNADWTTARAGYLDKLNISGTLVTGGTGAGQIDLDSGRVKITEAQIDQIVDETWDELASAHVGAGSLGALMGSIFTEVDGLAVYLAEYSGGTITFNLAGNVGGNVTGNLGGNVSGNVNGKVLGGGGSTITGVGAWADERNGAAIAPASTALSNAVWTDPKAGFLTGDAFVRLGAPAGASVSADVASIKSDTTTLLSRITASLFSGITSLGQWLGLIAGKQVGDTTARTEVRATGAGSGTYDETSDSQEAIRDRGDASWTTATGFAVPGSAMTLTSGERDAIAAALLDLANGVETSVTVRQTLRALAAGIAANVTGGGASYKAIGNPGTTRLAVVDDGGGDRTVTPSL